MKQALLSIPLIFASTVMAEAQEADIYSAQDAGAIFSTLNINPDYLQGAFLGACILQDTYPIWDKVHGLEKPDHVNINGLNISCPDTQQRTLREADIFKAMMNCTNPEITQTYNCQVNYERNDGITHAKQLQYSIDEYLDQTPESILPLQITLIGHDDFSWSYPTLNN